MTYYSVIYNVPHALEAIIALYLANLPARSRLTYTLPPTALISQV